MPIITDFANRISSVTTDGQTWSLTPAKIEGVVDVNVTGFNASNLASSSYLATDPVAVYTDENANETRYRHDQYGHVVEMTNALNQTWIYDRDANGLLVALTEPDPAGAGPLAANRCY